MSMVIYTNMPSITAQGYLNTANTALNKSIERLSSGLRINSAADDASGLAISEKLRGQIRGLAKASMNAQDAVSYLQTAEGGMEVIGNMLQRMRELAVQAGNGTYTSSDRQELQKEVDQLKAEINRVSASTEFNTKKLLTGDAAALWSTNSKDVEAIVRGAPAEGNYKLAFDVDPGQNAVYKTDIMRVNKDLAMLGTNSSSINSIEASGDMLALQGISVTTSATGPAASGPTVIDAQKTGTATISSSVTVASTLAKSGYIQIEFTTGATVVSAVGTAVTATVRFTDAATGQTYEQTGVTFSAGGSSSAINFGAGVGTVTLTMAGAPAGNIVAGDKLLAVQSVADATFAPAADMMVKVGANGPEISVKNGQTQAGSFTYMTLGAEGFQSAQVTVKNGAPFQAGTFTINVLEKGDVATSDVKLKDIDLFTNADGRMILDNTQSLTVYGNSKQAVVTMEGNDTLNDFAAKLQTAINITLDMGATGVAQNSLVNFITTANATAGGNGAVPGTFIIQSALMGSNSELKFAGDESLINALSLATIQEAKNSDTTVTVTDAHTGKLIGSDKVSDNILRGVIEGIDVKINPTSATTVTFNAAGFNMSFAKTADQSVAFLHVVDNRTEVQIGANEGQTFDISIGQIDTTALEIDDAFVMTMQDSQKAITKFDQALARVNSSRATIGAQINRLEYSIDNLATSRENLTAAESRIRDLDIAEESATFARNQILVNSAVAMVAQANTLPQTALQLIGR